MAVVVVMVWLHIYSCQFRHLYHVKLIKQQYNRVNRVQLVPLNTKINGRRALVVVVVIRLAQHQDVYRKQVF